jgi:lambda family phage portal protein
MKKPTFAQRVAKEIRGGRSFFSSVFSAAWSSAGSMINTYDAVDPRNMAMRGTIARPTSAGDLVSSLPYIRNLCRNYERNNPTVRAATEGICANVVGSGIALEPDTGDADTDKAIREAWLDYCRDCFVDGMGMYEGQTLAMREVVVAGESIWRLVMDPERSSRGRIPLCILPLESEWLGDNGGTIAPADDGFVGGIYIDKFGRPSGYALRGNDGKIEKVAPNLIIHAFERRRALQIRGEPWFSPILTTLKQEKDLVIIELEGAKVSSGFAVAIETAGGMPDDLDEKGSPARDINIGQVTELMPGEKVTMLSHNRPVQQIKEFRSMLRGDEASALRIGRRWLDRDISDCNYTSVRADMLDQERLTKPVQDWFGKQTVGKVYKAVLPYLALKCGIATPRDNFRLVPDGQPYVDPLKDAQAAAFAISFGLSTYEAEIGKRGGDYKAVWAKLAEEKKLAEQLNLVLQTPGGIPWGDQAEIEANAKAEAAAAGGGGQARDKNGKFG